jgi:RNA polymerase sigma-70 factor (ECF subfamily)
LAQDVFLHIVRKCHLYDSSKSTARSWIVQMTYFQALNRKGYLTERHYYAAVNLEGSDAEKLAAPIRAEAMSEDSRDADRRPVGNGPATFL